MRKQNNLAWAVIISVFIYLQMTIFTGVYRHYNVEDSNPLREVGDFWAGIAWPLYWNIRIIEWVVR